MNHDDNTTVLDDEVIAALTVALDRVTEIWIALLPVLQRCIQEVNAALQPLIAVLQHERSGDDGGNDDASA